MPSVGKRLGISTSTVKSWWQEDRPVEPAVARTRERMAELIYDTLADILTAVRGQLLAATDEKWLADQNAGDVAAMLGTEVDSAIRLLSGFRPAADPEQPALEDDSVVDATAWPADDGLRE